MDEAGEPGPGPSPQSGLPPSLPGLSSGYHSIIKADLAQRCPEPMTGSPVIPSLSSCRPQPSGRGICYVFNFIKEGVERGNAASPHGPFRSGR